MDTYDDMMPSSYDDDYSFSPPAFPPAISRQVTVTIKNEFNFDENDFQLEEPAGKPIERDKAVTSYPQLPKQGKHDSLEELDFGDFQKLVSEPITSGIECLSLNSPSKLFSQFPTESNVGGDIVCKLFLRSRLFLPREDRPNDRPKPFDFSTPAPTSFTSKVPSDYSNMKLPKLPAVRSKPAAAVATPAKQTPAKNAKVQNLNARQPSPVRPLDQGNLKKMYEDTKGAKCVLNLIVVGHVDAGKSTLMGNLLCQLGHISDKQLAKFQWEAQKTGKASFAFAWVLDQTSEERERGVTMDIAHTCFETESKRIVLLDAPGHKDFVPQVISGACQADYAILVINATRGEFETGFDELNGGQTREHARLIRLLGVTRVIVAVNKLDKEDWSEDRFKTKLTSFFGTLHMTSIQFCPLSGLYGVNLTSESARWSKLKVAQSAESDIRKLAPWYKGVSLLQMIDALPDPERRVDAPLRFLVSDMFKPVGSSVCAVIGRVISGGVSAGVNLSTSKVLCQPSGVSALVKSIKSLSSSDSSEGCLDDASGAASLLNFGVTAAFAGDQVALLLQGIDPMVSLAPGDVIVDPADPLPLTTRVKAKLLVFSIEQPITKGFPCIMYFQCRSLAASISKLISAVEGKNKSAQTGVKPRFLLSNYTAEVEIKLESAICMEPYEKCKALGRFMLRNNGKTIAGGTVTHVYPVKNKVPSLNSSTVD
ncbi:HBS1-like protein [Cichlidogyrus casuarinus]|uniref:HBS1-like protein n=1 Tax=Cichlidogyrus casuarinus TaxID=1844966 RepID=A0ABD2Q2T3_9PLAT